MVEINAGRSVPNGGDGGDADVHCIDKAIKIETAHIADAIPEAAPNGDDTQIHGEDDEEKNVRRLVEKRVEPALRVYKVLQKQGHNTTNTKLPSGLLEGSGAIQKSWSVIRARIVHSKEGLEITGHGLE